MHESLTFRSSTRQLADSGTNIAILSVGSTEQCGPFLPLHLDTLVAEYFAQAYGRILGGYVLPTLPFNTSEEHASFRGTISLRPTTVMAVLEEVVEGLRGQGFLRQVLTVGHGGSYWVSAFIKQINWRFKDIVVVSAHHGGDSIWREALERAGLGGRSEIHGGAVSRALALYLDPASVQEGEYGMAVPQELTDYMDYATWDRITPAGSWGRYSASDRDLATADAGRTILEYFVREQGAQLVHHLHQACRIKGIGL
jgi:creatinine amidohydrolase